MLPSYFQNMHVFFTALENGMPPVTLSHGKSNDGAHTCISTMCASWNPVLPASPMRSVTAR